MKTIIGGGLSGLASAITLTASGEKVQLIERSKHLGMKFPESVHAFRNYDNTIDEIDFIKSRGYKLNDLLPIHKIIKVGPSLNPSEVYSKKEPMFYAVKRGTVKESIDYQLIKQAEANDVEFVLGKNKHTNYADIIATGAKFINGMGYGHHYKNVNVDEDAIIFLLDERYSPKGYAYAIPYGKHEISVVVTSFVPSSFNKMHLFLKNLIENVPLFSKLIEGGERGPPFAKIVFYNIPETARIGKKLVIGEAAGFIEADRGFGMHYALESGFLAARSIVDGFDYDLAWKNSFETQLLKAFRRRLVLNKLENNHYDQLINAGTKMSTEEYVNYKETQNTNMIKKFFLNLHMINEVKKLRKKFNVKRIYG